MPAPRYAVFGHPVAHSRSPAIHAAFAAQAGIALTYERIDAPPDGFAEALAHFGREGGRGANVTLPHKAAARLLCDTLSERAERAGAVNTLVRVDAGGTQARWHGDNTDGIGLVRALRDRGGIALAGMRVLLLGAGGAGAGVAPALLDAGVGMLAVANRDAARARALVAHLADPPARALDVASLPHAGMANSADATGAGVGDAFDIVINATSAARTGAAPWAVLGHCLSPEAVAVDLGYGDPARPFLDFAAGHGVARRVDGLGMLVEQAAESFRLWHGVMPDTAPVHALLREHLASAG